MVHGQKFWAAVKKSSTANVSTAGLEEIEHKASLAMLRIESAGSWDVALSVSPGTSLGILPVRRQLAIHCCWFCCSAENNFHTAADSWDRFSGLSKLDRTFRKDLDIWGPRYPRSEGGSLALLPALVTYVPRRTKTGTLYESRMPHSLARSVV